MGLSAQVIEDFLECMQLFSVSEETTLRERIGDETYYLNFVALARSVAPDGDEVKIVGFTAFQDGKLREVALTKEPNQLPLALSDSMRRKDQSKEREPMHIQGFLKRADALKENRISIKPNRGKPLSIIVPEGLMDDIVRPMWGREVIAQATRSGRHLQLIDIKPANKGADVL
jgi:hypothetical protein